MSKLALIWSAITAGGAAATTGVLVATGVIDIDRIFSKQQMAPAPLVSSEGGPKSTPAPEKVAVAQPSDNASEAPPTPAEEAVPAKENAPSFDIVRVEPSGDAVVAGQSEPGAIVALLSDGKVVGKTVADGGGAWTIVLDKPLEPGDHDISATSMGPTGSPQAESEEHVAVSVPKDDSEELIVVMSKPGAPTKVLQKPAEVAQKPTEEPKVGQPVVVAASEPENPAGTPVAEVSKATKETPTAETPKAVATTESPSEAPQTVVAAEPKETQPTAAAKPATQTTAAAEPATQTMAAAEPATQTTTAAEPATQTTTAAEPATQTPASQEPTAAPKVAIQAAPAETTVAEAKPAPERLEPLYAYISTARLPETLKSTKPVAG